MIDKEPTSDTNELLARIAKLEQDAEKVQQQLENRKGRPVKDESERREKFIIIRLNPDEKLKIKQAAAFSGKTITDWAREIIVKASEDVLSKWMK
jgi:hypothetical protein